MRIGTSMMRQAARWLLAVVAFSAALAAAEGIVRWLAPQPLSGMWREPLPSGLYVNKSAGSARHHTAGHSATYRFHPPHLRDTPWRAGGIRVLVLGDSFTFGMLLNADETYVRRLQDAADAHFGTNRFCLLNAACGGWGTSDYVAFLEDVGDQVRPDAVLVFLGTDDIGRSIRRGLHAFDRAGGLDLVRRAAPVNRMKSLANRIPGYALLTEHSHLVQLVRRAAIQRSAPPPPRGGDPVPASTDLNVSPWRAARLGDALFLRAREWCDARGIPLWVTTTGRHDREIVPGIKDPTRMFMMQAEEFFRLAAIPFADISCAYQVLPEADRAALTIPVDGHPSAEGARFIADHAWGGFLEERMSAYLASRPPAGEGAR